MSFLTSQPDLSGTIYENQSLHEPRAYLVSEITKVDADWLTNPQGPLGDYWKRDDTLSACYLLRIAWMVSSISNNISQRSVMRLQGNYSGTYVVVMTRVEHNMLCFKISNTSLIS